MNRARQRIQISLVAPRHAPFHLSTLEVSGAVRFRKLCARVLDQAAIDASAEIC